MPGQGAGTPPQSSRAGRARSARCFDPFPTSLSGGSLRLVDFLAYHHNDFALFGFGAELATEDIAVLIGNDIDAWLVPTVEVMNARYRSSLGDIAAKWRQWLRYAGNRRRDPRVDIGILD